MTKWAAVFNRDGTPIDSTLLERFSQRLAYCGSEGLSQHIMGALGFVIARADYTRQMARSPLPLTMESHTLVGSIRLDERAALVEALRRSDDAAADERESDAALFLRAFRRWGEGLYAHVRGQFCAAVWCCDEQRLIAVRDHFGLLPLYYASVGSAVVVSMELSAIRLHPAVSARLNDEAVIDFLLSGSVTATDQRFTIFRDIQRLEPGAMLDVSADRLTARKVWTLPVDQPMLCYQTEEEYIDHYLDVFGAAVTDRLDADQMVVLMSGGLDSPSIAAIAQEVVKTGRAQTRLTAYTSVFEQVHPDGELPFAQAAADHIGIPLVVYHSDADRLVEPLPLYAEPREEYTNGHYANSTMALMAHGRVLLYGEAADSLMRYEVLFDVLKRHSLPEALALYFWLWRFLKKRPPLTGLSDWLTLKQWGKPRIPRPYDYPVWLNPDFERAYAVRERWEAGWQPKIASNHKRRSLAYATLTAADWSTDLEFHQPPPFAPPYIVMPFLDLRVVNFLMALPPIPFFRRKYLFRRAMQGRLPQALLERPKVPLGTVLSSLLAQPEAAWVDTWQPCPALEPYVLRERVPSVRRAEVKPANAYVNMRPLLLNHWLSHLEQPPIVNLVKN